MGQFSSSSTPFGNWLNHPVACQTFTLTLIIKQMKILMNLGEKKIMGKCVRLNGWGKVCLSLSLSHFEMRGRRPELPLLCLCVLTEWEQLECGHGSYLSLSLHPSSFYCIAWHKGKGNKPLPSTAFSIWKPYFVWFLSPSLSHTNCFLTSSVCALCLDTPLSSFSRCLSLSSLRVLLPF